MQDMIGHRFRNLHNMRQIVIESVWISDTGTVFFKADFDSFTMKDLQTHWTPIVSSQEEE
jgi:hypothetical protein